MNAENVATQDQRVHRVEGMQGAAGLHCSVPEDINDAINAVDCLVDSAIALLRDQIETTEIDIETQAKLWGVVFLLQPAAAMLQAAQAKLS